MNNREVDLIHKAIDGTLSNREKDRIDQLLADNSDFRRAYDSHMAAAEALSRVQPVDAPPELHHKVMNTINHHRYPRPHTDPSFAATVSRAIRDIGRLFSARYVTGFVTGAVAACLLLGMVYDWPSIDADDVGGTIGTASQGYHQTVKFSGGKGDIDWSYEGTRAVADLRISSAGPVQLQVSFFPETADIVSIAQDAFEPLQVTINGSTAIISHTGSNRYVITVSQEQGPAGDLSLSVNDIGGTQVFYLPSVIENPGTE